MEINTKDLRQPVCQLPQVKDRLEKWTKPQLTKDELEQKQIKAQQRKLQLAKKTFKSVTRAKVESGEALKKQPVSKMVMCYPPSSPCTGKENRDLTTDHDQKPIKLA